jgi:Na+-driven multidrug efflux pump
MLFGKPFQNKSPVVFHQTMTLQVKGECIQSRVGSQAFAKEGMRLAILNTIIFAIPYFIFPGTIIRIFSSDPDVINNGIGYLRIVYAGLVFVVFTTIYGGVFQGAGDTFPPMISSFIANVILKLPLAYLLANGLGMGTNGVWASIALSVVIESVIIIIYFKQNRWKEKVI